MIGDKVSQNIIKSVSYTVLIIMSLLCIFPLLMIISASFSEENRVLIEGFSVLPREFTLTAYKMVFKNPDTVVKAYITTIYTTLLGAGGGTLITAMAAYPLVRSSYKPRKIITMFFLFTMLFHGGAVSSYLVMSKYLHLQNNILVLIIPGMFSAYNCFVMRTYFNSIASEVIEAAKIDGASEFKIFFSIVMPMSVVAVATIALLKTLTYWNSWYNCMMFMTDEKNLTLQYYLYRTMSNIQEILKSQESGIVVDTTELPNETARMAMCVLAAGPMVFIFMFFQKYFVGGISVGSVKG